MVTKYNGRQAQQLPTVEHCEAQIMQIQRVVCQKMAPPNGLDSDHRLPTEHWGIVGTEFLGCPNSSVGGTPALKAEGPWCNSHLGQCFSEHTLKMGI